MDKARVAGRGITDDHGCTLQSAALQVIQSRWCDDGRAIVCTTSTCLLAGTVNGIAPIQGLQKGIGVVSQVQVMVDCKSR